MSSKISGVYYSGMNNIGPNSAELIIDTDSTFLFKGWSDILGEVTKTGNWFLYQDTLFLISKKVIKKDPIRFEEKFNPSIVGTRVRVLEENTLNLVMGCAIYFNNEPEVNFSGFSGEIKLNHSIDSIRIKYLSNIDSLFTKKEENNDIIIYINFSNFTKIDAMHLPSRWLFLNKKKLVPLDEGGEQINKKSSWYIK